MVLNVVKCCDTAAEEIVLSLKLTRQVSIQFTDPGFEVLEYNDVDNRDVKECHYYENDDEYSYRIDFVK